MKDREFWTDFIKTYFMVATLITAVMGLIGSILMPEMTFGYQAFSGERNLGRDNAIMMAFGLHCTLQETQRLLRLAGASELWPKVPRDAIIIFCLEHGMTRVQCDDELYRLGEPTLLSAED